MKKERLLLIIASSVAFTALVACQIPGLSSSKNENEPQAKYVEDMGVDIENEFDLEAFKQSAEKITNGLDNEPEEEVVPEEEYEYENLEDFFTAPENKLYLVGFSNLPDEYKNVFTDMKVSFEGNRMIYEYYYADNLGDAQAAIEENSELAKGKLFEALRSVVDVKDPMEMRLIYYNNDGSVAADVVVYEDKDSEYTAYETNAKEGTIQYYYESTYGTDYWEMCAKQALEGNTSVYSDLLCECNENDVKYTYTYANNVGDVQAATDAYFTDELKERTLDMLKIPSGVNETVTITYLYLNPDGSTAAEVTFEG